MSIPSKSEELKIEIDSDKLALAAADKMYQKKITDVYDTALKQFNMEAKQLEITIEQQIQVAKEQLKALEIVHNDKASKFNSLSTQDMGNDKKIKALDQQLKEAQRGINQFASPSIQSQGGGAPPPPPSMGPPPPPSPHSGLKKSGTSGPKARTQKEAAPAPASFDPTTITGVKLRSSRAPDPRVQGKSVSQSPSESKLNREESIKKLKNEKQTALDRAIDASKKNIAAKERERDQLLAKIKNLTKEVLELEITDPVPDLSKIVMRKGEILAEQENEAEFLNKKKGLLEAIQAAQKELPLPEQAPPQPVFSGGPPPPPPPGPPPPPMINQPKPLNIQKKGQQAANSKKADTAKRVSAGDIANSPQYQKIQAAAAERARLEKLEDDKKQAAEEKRLAAELKAQMDKVTALLENEKASFKPSEDALKRLESNKKKLSELQQREVKPLIDHTPELSALKQQLDAAQQAQQEDYKRRLAERDGTEYVPPSVMPSSNAPLIQAQTAAPHDEIRQTQLAEQLSALMEIPPDPHAAHQDVPPSSTIHFQQAQPPSNVQRATVIEESSNYKDRRMLVERFLKDYNPGLTANSNRKEQKAILQKGFDANNEIALNEAIEKVRSQMFQGKGTDTLVKSETRKLGKSNMEQLIKSYIALNNPSSAKKPTTKGTKG